jgi:hypothetical protein
VRRLWITLLALFVAAALAGWLGANWALEAATRSVLVSLVERTREGGFALRAVDFESARLSSLRSVTWGGIRAGLEREGSVEGEPELLAVSVERVTLSVAGRNTAALEASGVDIARSRDSPEGPADETLLVAERLRVPFPVDTSDPARGLQAAGREVVRLARTGSTPAVVEFTGTAVIRLLGGEIRLGLRTRQTEEGTTLIADPDDLRSLSALFDQRLTDAEIELISAHVLRAPRLLAIRDQAEWQARDAWLRHPGVSEDAYRHVLWSYLLTREFGAAFAEAVTDAHERGGARNTAAERHMDYRNNALGRSYAERGVPEAAVLEMVRHDPDAVIAPEG